MAKRPTSFAAAPEAYARYVPGQGMVFALTQEDLDRRAPVTPPPAPETKRQAFKSGLESAISGVTTGLPYAVRKATDTLLPEQEAQYQQRLQASAAKQEQLLPGGPAGFGQGAGLGRIVGENLAYSTPQMGAQLVAGVGGGLVGGPVGAGLTAGAVGSAMYTGTNVARATDGGQSALTLDEANRSIGIAPAQAAIDVLGARYLPGVGKYLGNKGFSGGAFARAAKGGATGSLVEGFGEGLQQGGERYAAGLDLASPDAGSEYGQAIAIGGLLGGPFGAVGGVTNKPKAAAPPPPPATETGAPADMLDLRGGTFNEKQGPAIPKADDLEGRVRQHLGLTADVEGERQAITAAMSSAQANGDMATFYKMQDNLARLDQTPQEDIGEAVKSLQNQKRAIEAAMGEAKAKGDRLTYNELGAGYADLHAKYFESTDPDIIAERSGLAADVDDAYQAFVKAKKGKATVAAQARLTDATNALNNFDIKKNVSPVQEYINAQQKEADAQLFPQRDLLSGETVRGAQPDLLRNVGSTDMRSPYRQMAPGTQPDLFGGASVAPETLTQDAPADTQYSATQNTPLFDRRPLSTVALDYTQAKTLMGLRRGAKLTGKVTSYAAQLSARMADLFRTQDVQGLRELLGAERDRIGNYRSVDEYLPTLDRAEGIVSEFEQRLELAKSQENNIRAREGQARAAPGTEATIAPAMQDAVSVARLRDQNAQAAEQEVIKQAQAQREAGFAQANQQNTDNARLTALKGVLSNPTHTNYHNEFQHMLTKIKQNAVITPEENNALEKAQAAQKAREEITETFNNEPEKAAPEPEFAEPERGPEDNGVESFYAPPKPPKPEAPARPELKLSSYSDQDLQSLEAARNRRAARALREEPSTVVEPKQGELFTEKGNPTKAAAQKGVKSGRPRVTTTGKEVVDNLAKDIAENPDASRKDIIADIAVAIELVQNDVPPVDRLGILQNIKLVHGETLFNDAMELYDKASKAEKSVAEQVKEDTPPAPEPTPEPVDLKKVTEVEAYYNEPEAGVKEWVVEAKNANGDYIGEPTTFPLKRGAKAKEAAMAELKRREAALKNGDQEGALGPFVEKKAEPKPPRKKRTVQNTAPATKAKTEETVTPTEDTTEATTETDADEESRAQALKYGPARLALVTAANLGRITQQQSIAQRMIIGRPEFQAKFTPDEALAAMREYIAKNDLKAKPTTAPQAPETKYRPVSERQNTAQVEARAEVYAVLRAELDRLGLSKAGLQVLTTLEGRDFFNTDWRGGFDYNTGLVTVVMQKGRGSNYTLGHEAIHALEHFGLIGDKEKGAVVLWAKSQKDIKKFIEDNYSDKTKDEQDSEYVAEAYARWLQKEDELPGRVRLFFRKIVGFLNAFNSFFRKQGFTSPDMVLEAINAGYFKGRKEGKSTLGYKNGIAAQAATNEAYKDASRLAAENIGGVGNRIASATVIANKLIDMAVKAGVPSARKFERLLAEQGSVIARLDRMYENLSDRFDGLKNAAERGVGKGSINGFIQNMVFDRDANNKPSRMWGFDPNYTNEDGSKAQVQINPDLAKQFDALSPEAQKIVRDVFKTSRDNLYAKKKVVMEAFASEYDALIKDAKDRGDAKDEAKYERQKKREISKYDRLMKIDPNMPYAPIKRFGDFVVVGRSKEYLEAEANAEREKTPEAWEALRKLQEDGEHYFVDYAQTRLEAQTMRDKIAQNYEHPDFFRKDEASNAQTGGSSMFGAFQRMQKLIQEQGGAMDPAIRKHLNALSTELYLQTLSASSSRKAEMTRRLVHAGDLDMVRGAIAQGRSDARFIGTIKKNGEIADTLKAMSKEAKGDRMNSDKARELVQQIAARHAANLAPVEQNAFVDKVLSLTTGQYLITSPMFFLQQAIQNGVITVPVAAARHGYARTFAALQKGYQTVGDAWSGADVSKPLDIDKLQGVDRVLALFLSDRNALDVGIDKDMGNWTSGVNNPTSNAISTVMKKIGGVTRKLEAINRLSSGKMMFELESEKATASNVDPEAYASYLEDFKETHPDLTPFTKEEFAAANEALRIVMDTHGDYSMSSAPTWMRGSFGRILTQFKKFQIMQLSLYTQAINNAFFDKGVSAAEKEVARKTLLYMTGHAALFAGALGIPGAGAGEWLWEAINKLMGREGPFTAESDLRKAIGNDQLANLLINGAPTLAGIDLSGSLGQGNLLSVAPYAEAPTDEDKYKDFVLRMLGPAIGGVGLDYAKGLGFMADGQYYKGLEKMLPKGVSNIVKAFRESSEGVTDKGGETTVSPDKISTGETIATALGVRTTDVSNRQYRQGRAIETKEYFQNQTAKLKREYIAAASKKDGSKMQELRQKWAKVQGQRADAGLARQPLSDLIKAPRELAKKKVIGGVKFTKATRRMAEQLAEETGEEEE